MAPVSDAHLPSREALNDLLITESCNCRNELIIAGWKRLAENGKRFA